ncbi:MAG: putative ribosome biogenesis GTPase A [Candidatus Heimdallarchaeota archaeon LC_3]|nr:MAG: putative ribosome biogenesis GTPase A [Candidatus Heimdallarchaeota archaeon LC_3]
MAVQGPSSLKRRKEHRLVYKMMQETDLTIQVLDARFPHRTRSPAIEIIAKSLNKPLLNCISKSDLIPKEVADKWKEYLNQFNPTIHISSRERMGTSRLRRTIFRISPFVPSSLQPLTICIVGYPNVGKSSLINVLAGRHSAPVSIRAGFTRTIRKVKITPKLYLIDTPGVTPIESLELSEKVYLCTISPEDILDPDLIINYLFEQAKKFNQVKSWESYLKQSLDQPIESILAKFAKQRGLIRKGNDPQIEEAARVLIRDFSKGKIKYYEDPQYL